MNKNSNFLIVLVGLPASGKSTFAIKLKKILESNFQKKVKIIDPDKIRINSFSDSFDFRNEAKVRKKNIKLVKKYLTKGDIVISDDLNYYSSMRHDLKLITDSLNVRFYIIYVSAPLELCLKRNEERGKPIPNDIIEKIYSKFDYFDKYKWDKPFATYDITQAQNIIQFIEILSNKIALELQEQKKEKKSFQNKSSTSILEVLDLTTRKYINEILKNPKYRNSTKSIIKARKSFIKNISDKEFDVNQILEEFKLYLNKKLNI